MVEFDDDSNLTRMANKTGQEGHYRVIYKSDLIPTRPMPSWRAAARPQGRDHQGLQRLADQGQGAFDKLSDRKDREFIKSTPILRAVVELIKFIDQLRKQKS